MYHHIYAYELYRFPASVATNAVKQCFFVFIRAATFFSSFSYFYSFLAFLFFLCFSSSFIFNNYL